MISLKLRFTNRQSAAWDNPRAGFLTASEQ